MGIREQVGRTVGQAWAPAVAAISRHRHARMFHATGYVFAGHAFPEPGPFEALGQELAGRVLARASAALWRRWEHLDVLGLALRFRAGDGPDLGVEPEPGDQDLLAATIRSPLTMLGAPLATDASDFAGNTYWAVSPFAHAVGRIELRLVPAGPRRRPTRGVRDDRLYDTVRAGQACWQLEARRTLHLGWHRVARIELTHPLEVDQDALAFDPFRGRLRPVGVVQWIRKAVYAAGQRARPHGVLAAHP